MWVPPSGIRIDLPPAVPAGVVSASGERLHESVRTEPDVRTAGRSHAARRWRRRACSPLAPASGDDVEPEVRAGEGALEIVLEFASVFDRPTLCVVGRLEVGALRHGKIRIPHAIRVLAGSDGGDERCDREEMLKVHRECLSFLDRSRCAASHVTRPDFSALWT